MENQLYFKELSEDEIIEIYNKYAVNDFPKDELKTLSHMLQLLKDDKYICKGVFLKKELVAYTFFAVPEKNSSICLLDFFAVNDKLRGKNFGGKIIQLLKDELLFSSNPINTIIAEIEDPNCAKTPEEKEIRVKREGFYKKNGFIKSNIKSISFGVDLLIIYLSNNNYINDNELSSQLNNIYKAIFPKNALEKDINIKILDH